MRRKTGRKVDRRTLSALLLALLLCFGLTACVLPEEEETVSFPLEEVPPYSGEPIVYIDGNRADFTPEEMTTKSYESYAPLDRLGRCGTAEACVGLDLMPTGEREGISEVHPAGWHRDRYDFIDGENLYNRCHLIAYSLAGENANENNLVTGTRYLNTQGMLPYEEWTTRYVHRTGNHVMYRVTPVYEGNELIPRGIHMMAKSVEDNGEGVEFNIYCYNVQPRIHIDYATGDNRLMTGSEIAAFEEESGIRMEDIRGASGAVDRSGDGLSLEEQQRQRILGERGGQVDYVVNVRSGKFHLPDCEGVADISPGNRLDYTGDRKTLTDAGYTPCRLCDP